MKKQILIFGVLGGLISWVWFLVMGLTGGSCVSGIMGWIIGYAAILLSMTFVFFGVRSYRDNVLGGVITFGRALGSGLLIALAACVVYSLGWMIIQSIMMPDFYEKYGAMMAENMRKSGKPESEIADSLKMMGYASNPFLKFLMTLMEPLPAAILVSPLSALILKTRKKQTANTTDLA